MLFKSTKLAVKTGAISMVIHQSLVVFRGTTALILEMSASRITGAHIIACLGVILGYNFCLGIRHVTKIRLDIVI